MNQSNTIIVVAAAFIMIVMLLREGISRKFVTSLLTQEDLWKRPIFTGLRSSNSTLRQLGAAWGRAVLPRP